MKNLPSKTFIAILLLFGVLISIPAKAQTMDAAVLKKSTPQQRADWQNKMMKQDLKLTDAQYAQVSKLNLEYAQKMQPLFTSIENRFSKGLQARSIMKEKESKLKAILTEQQYQGYQKIVKENSEELKKALLND